MSYSFQRDTGKTWPSLTSISVYLHDENTTPRAQGGRPLPRAVAWHPARRTLGTAGRGPGTPHWGPRLPPALNRQQLLDFFINRHDFAIRNGRGFRRRHQVAPACRPPGVLKLLVSRLMVFIGV